MEQKDANLLPSELLRPRGGGTDNILQVRQLQSQVLSTEYFFASLNSSNKVIRNIFLPKEDCKWNCHTYHICDFRVAQARPRIVSQSDHVLVIPWKANIIHYPALSRNTYMVFLFLIVCTLREEVFICESGFTNFWRSKEKS